MISSTTNHTTHNTNNLVDPALARGGSGRAALARGAALGGYTLLFSTLYSIPYILYPILYTLYSILYTLYSTIIHYAILYYTLLSYAILHYTILYSL